MSHADHHLATAIKYIGTPAWRTKNNRAAIIMQERNEVVANDKVGQHPPQQHETAEV